MRSVFLLKCIVFKPYTMWSLRIRENIKTFLNLKVCRVQKASENKLHQRRKIFPGTKPRQYTVKLITFLWIQKKIGRTRALFSLDVAPLSTPCLPTTFPTKPRKNSDRKIETNSRPTTTWTTMFCGCTPRSQHLPAIIAHWQTPVRIY